MFQPLSDNFSERNKELAETSGNIMGSTSVIIMFLYLLGAGATAVLLIDIA